MPGRCKASKSAPSRRLVRPGFGRHVAIDAAMHAAPFFYKPGICIRSDSITASLSGLKHAWSPLVLVEHKGTTERRSVQS